VSLLRLPRVSYWKSNLDGLTHHARVLSQKNELDDLTDQFLVSFRDGKWTDTRFYHAIILNIFCNRSQDEESNGPDY